MGGMAAATGVGVGELRIMPRNAQTRTATQLAVGSLAIAFVAMSLSHSARAVELVRPGQPTQNVDGWLMSDWPATRSEQVTWAPANVRQKDGGMIELVLDAAPPGADRPMHMPGADRPMRSGEIQSVAVAETGIWSWEVQAPAMTDGAVLAMGLNHPSQSGEPAVEFAISFAGADTSRVHIGVDVLYPAGGAASPEPMPGAQVVVDLGFDAAETAHLYEIEVTQDSAVFRVDGNDIGAVTAEDIAGSAWRVAPLRSFVSLWPVDNSQSDWAGAWTDPGAPLVAQITNIALPPGARIAR